MKSFLCIALVLAISFTLFGCSALEELDLPPLPDVDSIKEQQAEEVVETSAPVETMLPLPTPEPLAAEHVIVNISSYSETFLDPQHGTEPILEYSYQLPVVYVEGRDEISAVINEHIAHINETYQTGNDYGFGTHSGVNIYLEMATDNYTYMVNTGEESSPLPYFYGYTVKVPRGDEKILSLRYNIQDFIGGAHGNYVDRAYVFDTVSGERITLDMLSPDADAFKSFLHTYMLSLYEADEGGYYSERVAEENFFEGPVSDALAALIREGSWYLGDKGMVVFSDIYELGPYAAGICEFIIPYSELAAYVDARWLPAERAGEGSFSVLPQSAIAEGSAQIIDRVTVDAGGEQLCLVAEGTVYDIRLSKVSYADRFYETAQLWACSYMEDCLLQLDVIVPEGIPDLMLRYTDGAGVEHTKLISRSGLDGSYTLIDDDIEAVG